MLTAMDSDTIYLPTFTLVAFIQIPEQSEAFWVFFSSIRLDFKYLSGILDKWTGITWVTEKLKNEIV